MPTVAKACDVANVEFCRAELRHHLDDAVAEALQARIFKDCTADGETVLTLAQAKLNAVARQCAAVQVCLDRPSVRHAQARAERIRGD